MRKLVLLIVSVALLNSCQVYRNYKRPAELPIDGLYQPVDSIVANDTSSMGDLPWQEVFQDTLLQKLITYGLDNNTDMQIALLRVDEAQARLKAAKLSFLPSVSLSPQFAINKSGNNSATKTYELPLQASWEVDLFGKLRNAKKAVQATLLQQEAYRQAVRSELIATIANDYYTLLMLDEQIKISQATLEIWKEQIRVMEAKFKVGEETENAIRQARANLYELEATHNDLSRNLYEAENAICTLLGTTYHKIVRSNFEQQVFPEQFSVGIPLRLLSKRPDVLQAEMALASSYYNTNQARAAFYPNLTLSGSLGWTNSLGQMVSNPGSLILSALASLAQPIFNRGTLISNLRVSKDEEQIALLTYKQTILDAGEAVNTALYSIKSVKNNLDKHCRQCDELRKAVNISEALYKTGNATYLDLLTARQSLLNAQLKIVSDQFEYSQSIINLYNALGGGAE